MAIAKVRDAPLRSSVQWFVYVILCLVSAGDGQWINVCMEGGWVNSFPNNYGEGSHFSKMFPSSTALDVVDHSPEHATFVRASMRCACTCRWRH